MERPFSSVLFGFFENLFHDFYQLSMAQAASTMNQSEIRGLICFIADQSRHGYSPSQAVLS